MRTIMRIRSRDPHVWAKRQKRLMPMKITAWLILLLVVFGAPVGLDAGADWPQFRGSDAGVAPDHPDLPDRWSETENVRWKVDIPGLGWSSPIVWERRSCSWFFRTTVSAGSNRRSI